MLVAVVVFVAAIGGGVGATPSGPATTANGSEAGNTTAPHENPNEVREAGDDRRVSAYLASRLGDRLTESALAISVGEYERGRAPLDEEYGDLLDQYGAVARDLDEEEVAERFNLTREQQRSVITTIENLEATRAEYEAAVEEGDEERRRELARELLAGAEELNQTATALTRQYTTLGNETGIDFEEAQRAIEDAQVQVGEAAVVIEQREFTATRLTAETNRTAVSVSRPATVSGRLTTANGTPVTNGLIRVRTGADSVATRTGRNGTFAATYRPLLASTAASNLTVAYAPARSDRYLPAVRTVPLSIAERANTSVTLTEATGTVAFDQPVRADGTVQVDGAPEGAIGGIPVVLAVDGRRLATAETEPDGEFVVDGVLPADVPAGETDLEVAIDRRDAAIDRSAAASSLTVRSTPTTLSLTATADDGRNVTVSGALTAGEGTALPTREVAIAVGATETERVATGGDGRYSETVAIPDDVEPGESVTVTASFDAAGTNLQASTATRQVTPPQSSGANGGGSADTVAETTALTSLLVAGLIVVGALLVIGRRAVRRWGRRLGSGLGLISEPGDDAPPDSSTPGDAAGARAETNADAGGEPPSSGTPFDRARTALSAGQPDDAVRIAYAAMRSGLQPPEADATGTHWEFYRRWRDDADVDRTRLRTVTEAYETAAFAPDSVSSDTADDAVTASDELAGRRERADD
ncbi:hypothetical protein C463_10610 [Halorubrum californiense DSM 19288]|uniref:DUF4129 domain-containing protein n=1 Tax=Halorubrum californiense DSM 19288 TaxID=1227465 RepID=M0E4E0_9EURY|nr:hypothetical protein C463_10610 [Halorubrum californiense DSM 19288]